MVELPVSAIMVNPEARGAMRGCSIQPRTCRRETSIKEFWFFHRITSCLFMRNIDCSIYTLEDDMHCHIFRRDILIFLPAAVCPIPLNGMLTCISYMSYVQQCAVQDNN